MRTDLRQRLTSELLQHIHEAVIVLDADFRVEVWSPGAERIFGWRADEAVGQHVARLMAPLPSQDELDAIKARVQDSGVVEDVAIRQRKDGVQIVTEFSVSPLFDGPQFIGMLTVSREVTERERARAALQRRCEDLERLHAELLDAQRTLMRTASLDALTQIANRGAILDAAEEELRRARRTRRPLCVALLDLDHFKRLNDQHGHLVGDRVLALAAGTMQASLRASDHVGRYGGEEFCLVLPEASPDAGFAIVERVCQAVNVRTSIVFGEHMAVGLSAGIAALVDGHATDVESLLRVADRALYHSKLAGRGQVTTEQV